VGSKADLEERLGRKVRWLAYPFGGRRNVRPELLPLAEEAGYDACFTAWGGLVGPGDDVRQLPRVAVPYFKSLLHLDLHIRGCLRWAYALKRRLGLGGRPEPDSSAGAADAAAHVPPA